jgi:metal-responsive CopG/Arc/MetJ family transcriptional regulator
VKTAISLEGSLMQQADSAALDLGLSRSALIAQALQDLLHRRRHSQISEQLNQAYSHPLDPTQRRLVRKLKTKLLRH